MIVAGHAERYMFITEKIKAFGLTHDKPILRWICPVRMSKKGSQPVCEDLPFNLTGSHDQLTLCFA